MYAILGILLIVAGVLAILFMPDSNKSSTGQASDGESGKSTSAGSEKSEEELKKDAEMAAENRTE